MKKRILVISLGGSLIIPDNVDINFLRKFRKIIRKHTNKYKFVIVCGGGSIARKYIKALKEEGKSTYLQCLAGISATRMNARFMSYFFNQDPDKGIPHDMKEVQGLLRKNNIIFCGALRYSKNETSDGTAAKLARFLKSEFINLTNVPGLHDKNPKKFRNAKFIPKISWLKFWEMASKIKYQAGQHFVLDQNAAKVIQAGKIRTYILGEDMKNLDKFLSGKKFKGSIISD